MDFSFLSPGIARRADGVALAKGAESPALRRSRCAPAAAAGARVALNSDGFTPILGR
jgi:hypothetical protein